MISVVIPCYNREGTIKDAVYSVLEQSYSNLEIIVIDDCSNDQTVNVVKGIISSEPRVKLIELDHNRGANYARNIGVIESQGDYIAFQDSDDIWYKDKLKIQIEKLNQYGGNIIGSAMSNGKERENNTGNIEKLQFENFLPNNIISTQTILAKKSLLLKYRFNEELPRFQDWELLLRISQEETVLYYTSSLVIQRIGNDSITKNNEAGFKAIEIIKLINNEIFESSGKFRATYYYYKGILYCSTGFKHKGIKNFMKAFSNYPYFQIVKTMFKYIIKKR